MKAFILIEAFSQLHNIRSQVLVVTLSVWITHSTVKLFASLNIFSMTALKIEQTLVYAVHNVLINHL